LSWERWWLRVDDYVIKGGRRSFKIAQALYALLIASIFVLVSCLASEPLWETNDDVAMSMVAHGYGISAVGSPNLIFSNVLWGHLVRLTPEINGILGYSIATLGVLVLVGSILTYCLLRLNLGLVGAVSALILIMARPVLFPQFTVNAGLLMVAAVVCWRLFAQDKSKGTLVLGCLLAFFSYLVRSQEFFLVLFVALPLLPWTTLRSDPAAKIAGAALIGLIGISAIIDHQVYQGPEWKTFNELNPARAPFTDFGAGLYLKQRPDIRDSHGYSHNDIDLISKWFFVDSNIADPGKLNAMLKELGPLPAQGNSLANGWIGIKNLVHPKLLSIVAAAVVLAIIGLNLRVAMAWCLCIAALFGVGILGRPGVLRIYVPLICLLLVAPFLMRERWTTWRKMLGVAVIMVAMVLNSEAVFLESKSYQRASEETREGLSGFPVHPVVAWGEGFPYEAAYPLLKPLDREYRLYGLGVFTLAPFSLAYYETQAARSMTDLLKSEAGIPVIADEQRFRYLDTYCRERLHGVLEDLSTQSFGRVQVSWRRCVTA
jgi:hypothetical protein